MERDTTGGGGRAASGSGADPEAGDGGGGASPPYSIWIEVEDWGEGGWDPADEASDVVVTFADGRRWVASFVAYGHVPTLVARNQESGENLGGRYLWASDLVLVDAITRDTIEAVVADLVRDGGFESAFSEYDG